MRSRHLILVCAAASLAAASPALAAWESPTRASRGPLPAHSPQVAVNARGDAAAVWVRGTRRAAMIVTRLRPAGGAWDRPEAISRRGRPAIDPQVTIDAQGLVVVAWRQIVGRRVVRTERGRRRQAVYVARARERAVGDDRWSPISTLSSPRQKVGPPRVEMDGTGRAVAAWHWGTGTSRRSPGYVGQVQVSEREPDGSWTPARRVSRSSLCAQVRRPRVTVGDRGHAVVWWQCDLPGGRNTALAISRAPGADFGAEAELPFRVSATVSADVEVSSTGRAAAVNATADGSLRWWRGQVSDHLTLQQLAALGPNERSDADAGPPQVAVGASGDALTAWTDRRGRPRSAPITADLGVGAPSSLGSPSDDTRGVRMAMSDMTRRGVVAWVTEGRVLAATRAADGAIGAGAPVSGPGVLAADPPAVAVDAAGNAEVLWTRVLRGRAVVERAAGPVS